MPLGNAKTVNRYVRCLRAADYVQEGSYCTLYLNPTNGEMDHLAEVSSNTYLRAEHGYLVELHKGRSEKVARKLWMSFRVMMIQAICEQVEEALEDVARREREEAALDAAQWQWNKKCSELRDFESEKR